jgi:hypothetical protein
MPLAIQSSIRDNAGRKPWQTFYAASYGSIGAQITTFYTPPVDSTIEVTTGMFYCTTGTFTGQAMVTLFDGSNYEVLILAFNPAINYMFPMYGTAIFESPMYLQFKCTVSAQPATAYISLGGARYKRGEGVFD